MNSILVTPTPNLQESVDFYTTLGFNHILLNDINYVSDGRAIIEINADRYARAGVRLYKDSWNHYVDQLKEVTPIKEVDNGYLLTDTSGVMIYLVNGQNEMNFQKKEAGFSILGNYAGLSLEGVTIPHIYKVWKLLGFDITMGGEDKAWMVTENEDGLGISFMAANTCPHLFFNPSLTYFNGKRNLAIIKDIRDLGIPITEEITHFNKEGIVDNIIIRDPGGLGFFIFSD